MQQPNFLIFMTDQQRGDTVLAENPCLTPNLDRMRAEGVTFNRAYCPAPHCCPSRATFHSGLYPSEHGVWHNVNVANAITRGLRDGVRLWSEDLQEAGYTLDFSGKWHVSDHARPADHGWREHMATAAAGQVDTDGDHIRRRWEAYRTMPRRPADADRRPGEIVRPGYNPYTHYGVEENPFRDRDVVDAALEAMRSRPIDAGPWCQFVGTLGPHDPYRVPQRFLDMYAPEDIQLPDNFADVMADKPGFYRRTRQVFEQLTDDEHREAIRHYLAFCTYQDALFGELVDTLEQRGELDNTVVMYLSDHGDYTGEHGLWCKGIPCFEGAYHVPAIVRAPRVVTDPGRVDDRFVSLADFAPTILELAGVEVDRPFAGASLKPLLANDASAEWRDAVFTQTNGNELYGIQRSVRTDRWKYVFNGFDFDELYDLEQDPDETVNLAGKPEHKATIEALCRRLWQFAYERQDACINPYIMVGFAPVGPGVVFES